MIELTEQQRQELSAPEPTAIDPRTRETYVLVRRDAYERFKALLALDDAGDPLLSAASQPNGRCANVLDREWQTLQANLPALLEREEGRYVLIHGEQIVSIWDTQEQALEEGYRLHLFEPFLVHHIVAEEKPIFLPRGLL